MNGDELRVLREAAGVGLRELARAIGRDRGHLSRVERGEREATPAIVAAYQAALAAGTVDDMRRRSILAAGAALPAAMVLPDSSVTTHVGAAEVAAVRAVALDLDLAHPVGLHAAEAALQRAAAMLHARIRPAVRTALYEAVALLADRVGWGQHEAGRDASTALLFAYRTAQRGGDGALHAHALLDLAVTTPAAPAALATLDHALAGGVRGAERANVHAVAARRAASYDMRLAREHLARALDTEPAPVGGEWSQQITDAPGHLDAIVGFACYAADSPDKAERRLTRAVTDLAPNRQRTRARCHTRLAGLAMAASDDTGAAEHLSRALSLRRSVLVNADLQAFAERARSLGRAELARLAVSGS